MNDLSRSLPLFRGLYNRTPEDLRSYLLKDCIFELTASWKLLAGLRQDQTGLVFAPGVTSMPIAFARNLERVDWIGAASHERKVIAEIAKDKRISNLRCLSRLDERVEPYSIIVLVPGRKSGDQEQLHELLQKLSGIQQGKGEWWIVLDKSSTRSIAHKSKKAVKKILHSHANSHAASRHRVIVAPDSIASSLDLTRFLGASTVRHRAQLELCPSFRAPSRVRTRVDFKRRKRRLAPAADSGSPACTHTLELYCNHRRTSLLTRLVKNLNRHLTDEWQVGENFRVLDGGKVMVDLFRKSKAETQHAFLKLSLIKQAEMRLRENAFTLLRLTQAKDIDDAHRRLFPQVLAEGTFEKQAYYLESCIPGKSLDRCQPDDSQQTAMVKRVFDLWFAIQSHMVRQVKVTDLVFNAVFDALVHRYRSWLDLSDHDEARLEKIVAYWYEQFSGREIGIGLVHGDFSIKNIMADGGLSNITGIIDWDLTDFFSIPIIDTLHFFVRLDSRSFKMPPPMIALHLIREQPPFMRTYLHEGLKLFGYDEKDLIAVVMLYWLFRQRGYIGSLKSMDAKFFKRQFLNVLKLFETEVLSA